MPSTSGPQHRFMAKAMNDPAFAKAHGIKPGVAAEFVHADKGSPFARAAAVAHKAPKGKGKRK